MTFKIHDGVEIDGKSLTNSGGTLTWGGVSVGSGGGVTISSNANNRVLTGDGSNAVGETNLTFDGTNLQIVGSTRGLITEKLRLGATDTSFIERDSTVNIGYRADGVHRFWTYNSSWLERAQITDTGFNLLAGHSYQLGGTTVIDSSRNLTNIGTISSGALAVSGQSVFTGAGTSNTYQSVIKTVNSSSDQWGHITLSSAASNSVTNNYYLIGRGSAVSDRQMSFHIPTASNYGSGSEPIFRFASSGSDNLMTITANTGAVYVKGNITVGGTVTASGGNSGNWNTAYGWGNHASGGYLTSSSTQSKYLRSDADDSYAGTLTINGMDFKTSNVVRNLKIQASSGGSDVGISGFRADGGHGFQVYGDGSNYGFLDGNWSNWDLKKAKNGELYVDAGSGLQKVWHQGNDGSGSGLDADTLDTYQLNTGRANVANRVVATDSNGYIQAGWINTTSGARTTEAITRVYASDDAYLRYYTLANFGDQIASHINFNSLENKPTLSSLGYTGATNANNYVLPATVVIGNSTTAQPASDLVTFNSYNDGNSTSGDQSSVQFYNGSASQDAFVAFHVSGDYAGYFGLDGTTNDLFWGGWSVGNNKHKIFHAGNSTQFTSALNTKLAGIATSANNYSFPYSVSTGASASHIVQRDGNGYIFGNYLNMTGTFANSGAGGTMGYFTGTNGSDNYGRSWTAAQARTLLNVANGATANSTENVGASGSTLVKRHSSGYIYANYFNTTANDVSSGVTKVMVETGNDNFIRHGSAAAIRTFINVADGANNYSFPYSISTAATANNVVLRDSGGDITGRYYFGVHFNQSSSNSENPTIGAFWTNSTADNYNRKSTPAHVGSQIKAHIPCVRTDAGSTIGNNHTVVQRGQFTTGTSGQNNSAQASALSYHYGYQYGGAWTSPFPDLILGYHTGVRIGGYYGYGGTRFYDDHPSRTSTIIFSVANGDAHVRATNNIYAYTSDKRLKENFRPIENAVDKVKAIGGFIFDWRKDMMEKHDFTPDQQQDDAGLIAQEVQKVMPAAIKRAPFDHDLTKPNQSKSGEDFLTVQYEKMVPLLVEAIKEQQKQIDELKQKLETK